MHRPGICLHRETLLINNRDLIYIRRVHRSHLTWPSYTVQAPLLAPPPV